ncbi:MAG TPA: thymidine phosphorylase [Syntrophomonadaceae bacterium]|nr:thymidine phosphorylase [Syntrophomonadaceae bacterium]HQE23127.1 thymidine phosphorylase [Syntrophomonadaceae bacterium]
MHFQDLIEKKRDGGTLSPGEIEALVQGIVSGEVPDYQISAWAMAVYFQGMSQEETQNLAIAMSKSGDVIDLSGIQGVPVDKHSTGGVGDKTTLVAIPLAAAAGVPVAKMSGRGLGHTGGTIDKLESIPGFQVERTLPQVIEQVNRVKAAIISQMGNLVPADKKLYAIRDVTATVDSIPLIASSVMSKKLASGAQGIVLDVKVGRGAFMKSLDQARQLARTMVDIGQGAGRKVVAVLSDMNQPLGRTVGNALEVREALDTLQGRGPADLEELSVLLAAHMVKVGGQADSLEEALLKVRTLLQTRAGLMSFQQMVEAQGGSLDLTRPDYGLPQASEIAGVTFTNQGYVKAIDALAVGRTVMRLGAGRERLEDRIFPEVGVELHKKVGDRINSNDIVATIYARDKSQLAQAAAEIKQAYTLTDTPPDPVSLVFDTIT